MKYYRYETDDKSLKIYPLVCWHLGAEQCDLKFIKEMIERIRQDKKARWVYLGDGGECVTTASKGDVYRQRMSPDEQLEAVNDLLQPIKKQGLFGVTGNHDRRIFKLSGLDWAHQLCTSLGIPYMGNAAFARFVVNRIQYDAFFHHGIDSSSNLGGKLNKAKHLEQLVDADCIFSAHSHMLMDAPPSYKAFLPQNERVIRYKEVHNYICGCAYDSRVPGYAEEKGYPPIIPGHLAVTLHGHNNHRLTPNEARKQTVELWRGQA